jgi:hypothetical protein
LLEQATRWNQELIVGFYYFFSVGHSESADDVCTIRPTGKYGPASVPAGSPGSPGDRVQLPTGQSIIIDGGGVLVDVDSKAR